MGKTFTRDQVAIVVQEHEEGPQPTPVSFLIQVAPGSWAEYQLASAEAFPEHIELRLQDPAMHEDQAGKARYPSCRAYAESTDEGKQILEEYRRGDITVPEREDKFSELLREIHSVSACEGPADSDV